MKVGGTDLEEVEKDEKLGMVGLGEFGGEELLLPPSGLGSGTDARPHKSESRPFPPACATKIHYNMLLMESQ